MCRSRTAVEEEVVDGLVSSRQEGQCGVSLLPMRCRWWLRGACRVRSRVRMLVSRFGRREMNLRYLFEGILGINDFGPCVAR
jgi:hypothetical protein